MRMATVLISALAVIFAFAACKKGGDARAPEALGVEVAAAASALNAYMETRSFQDTPAQDMEAEARKAADAFAAVAAEGKALKDKAGGTAYDAVIADAEKGKTAAEALATALAAGPPAGDPAKAASLADAVAAWGDFSGAAPGAPASAEPPASGLRGKGHHYGWYKNPAWANDPASRGTGETAGTAAPGKGDRERERSGSDDGKGKGKGKNAGGAPGGSGGGKHGGGK